jgi:hypothetical protein
MAKATKVPAAQPNLFAKAKSAAATPIKKSKGTTINLPRDLDENGNLTGESKLLNEAVHDVIAADADEKAAKNKGNAAKGILKSWVVDAWAGEAVRLSTLPPTPITVTNHKGEAVTYVLQDKTQQNSLAQEQVILFNALLGEEVAASLIEERTMYAFNSDIMNQAAAGPKAVSGETVQDVIFAIVSSALAECPKISDEQKASLISATTKTNLRFGVYGRLMEICGANIGRVTAFLEAAGTSIVKYFRA